ATHSPSSEKSNTELMLPPIGYFRVTVSFVLLITSSPSPSVVTRGHASHFPSGETFTACGLINFQLGTSLQLIARGFFAAPESAFIAPAFAESDCAVTT